MPLPSSATPWFYRGVGSYEAGWSGERLVRSLSYRDLYDLVNEPRTARL